MGHLIKNNFYTILILTFLVTIVGGSFMIEFQFFGIQFYAFRVILFASVIYLLVTKKLHLYQTKFSLFFFCLLITWWLYAAISLSWTPDKLAGFKELFYLTIGVSSYVLLNSIKKKYSEFERWLVIGFIITFFSSFLIACWEINMGSHLVSNFSEFLLNYPSDHEIQRVPVVTFDNPNHYAIFIVLTVAIGFYQLLKRELVILWCLIIGLGFYLCHLLSARFGMISITLMGVLFLAYQIKIYPFKKKMCSFILLFSGAFLFLIIGVFGFHPVQKNSTNVIKNIHLKVQSENILNEKRVINNQLTDSLAYKLEFVPISDSHISTKQAKTIINYELIIPQKTIKNIEEGRIIQLVIPTVDTTKDNTSMSNLVRFNLIKNGWKIFYNSHFLGFGAGSFENKLVTTPNMLDTKGIVNPHNFFIEIITQYGLLVAGLFIILFSWIALILVQSVFKREITLKHLFAGMLLISFIFMSNANSSFLPLPLNWLMLILLVLVTDDIIAQKVKKDVKEN